MYIDSEIYIGKRGDNFPEDAGWFECDYIISFSSPWIIPGYLLEKSRIASINFHPGPPEYPGIGCTNFALYNEENMFGVTAHHMDEKVDTGKIIDVWRFPIFENDGVKELTDRCYHNMYAMFVCLVNDIQNQEEIRSTDEVWQRAPYTRKELNKLCEIKKDMTAEEVKKRVRALRFEGYPGAYIDIDGIKFIAE